MRDGSNLRTGRYGGSVANRIRLTLEVTEAVVGAAGADRTGIRISPVSPAGGAFDSDPRSVFFPLVRELNRFGLAYCHVVEGHTQGPREFHGLDFVKLRESFEGPWMVNNGDTREMATQTLESGLADLVAFGRAYIANPDLVERLRIGAPLNDVDWDHTFGGDERGYTDYRPLEAAGVRYSTAVPRSACDAGGHARSRERAGEILIAHRARDPVVAQGEHRRDDALRGFGAVGAGRPTRRLLHNDDIISSRH